MFSIRLLSNSYRISTNAHQSVSSSTCPGNMNACSSRGVEPEMRENNAIEEFNLRMQIQVVAFSNGIFTIMIYSFGDISLSC